MHLISIWRRPFSSDLSLPLLDPDKPSHPCAPFWLEIAKFTLAPVAMEDSDHEAHSSDEHNSCPASPKHSIPDHDPEQVPVTPPNPLTTNEIPLLMAVFFEG
ncbi:Chromatin-remodeling ATPase INO80 [Dissostichus eleginoides]|uniref:Chromatin-remodeling ATPase INO80 n=1 Tax=Dissostichus eleginoides TaxID=100907 RepID=A0AAD9CF77_DISEL|nr:Chromatin-remodeling ATPase INO80 [Dissostichus eleginoides]